MEIHPLLLGRNDRASTVTSCQGAPMRNDKFPVQLTSASSLLALLVAHSASAQTPPAANVENPLELIVVTGTRVADRSALETAVPVDIVSSAALENLGVTEINQALAVAL